MKALKQSQGICCTYNKFQVNSSKKWVVVLHAWDVEGSGSWEETAKGLNHKDFNVLLIDLPGFGQSQSPHESWGTDEYAQYVTRFLYELGIKPLIVIGHSFGGAIALKISTKSQLKIRVGVASQNYHQHINQDLDTTALPCGLILIAPAFQYYKAKITLQSHIKRSFRRFGRVLILLRVIGTIAAKMRVGLKYFFGDQEFQKGQGIMKKIAYKIRSEDVTDLLKSLTIPTLVVWGSNDQYMPIQNATSVITQLKLGELKVYDRASHCLQTTHTPILVEDINSFFEKNKYIFPLS